MRTTASPRHAPSALMAARLLSWLLDRDIRTFSINEAHRRTDEHGVVDVVMAVNLLESFGFLKRVETLENPLHSSARFELPVILQREMASEIKAQLWLERMADALNSRSKPGHA